MVMLRTDLNRLFTENIQSDVNLRVQDQVFPAHRAILSVRSPVFCAMFNHDMAESQTSDVEIPDLEAEIMKSLLKFLYTGESESLDYELASKLMMAADKYQVYSLKEKCANFLKSILSVKNVCDILAIADLVEHKILKASAVEFIVKHSDYIFCTDTWKTFIKNNLLLASERVTQVSLFLATKQKEKNPWSRNKPIMDKSVKSKTSSTSSKFGKYSNAKSTASLSIPPHSSSTTDILASSKDNVSCKERSSFFNFGLTSSSNLLSKSSTASDSPMTSNGNAFKFLPQSNSANRFSFSTPVSSNSASFIYTAASSSGKETSTSLNSDIKQSSLAPSFAFGSKFESSTSSATNSELTSSKNSFTLPQLDSSTSLKGFLRPTPVFSTVSPITSSAGCEPLFTTAGFSAFSSIISSAMSVPACTTSAFSTVPSINLSATNVTVTSTSNA